MSQGGRGGSDEGDELGSQGGSEEAGRAVVSKAGECVL